MAKALYNEWLTEDGLKRIEGWASDGLLNKEIAGNIGVKSGTFANWIMKHSEIGEALKKGRAPVVVDIENALIKRAKGFEYEETDIIIDKDDNGNTRQKVVKHKRYSLPDSSAAMFLLKNYKPEKYRNYNDLTKKQIQAEIRKMETEAKKAEVEIKRLDDMGEEADQVIIIDDLKEVKADSENNAEA